MKRTVERDRDTAPGERARPFMIGLNAVIIAVTDESPRVLTVRDSANTIPSQKGLAALPFGPLDPERDRTLERGVRGWVKEQTGLELGYVEQLYTFGDRPRDPIEKEGGPRVLSIAYLAGGFGWLTWGLLHDRSLLGDQMIDQFKTFMWIEGIVVAVLTLGLVVLAIVMTRVPWPQNKKMVSGTIS